MPGNGQVRNGIFAPVAGVFDLTGWIDRLNLDEAVFGVDATPYIHRGVASIRLFSETFIDAVGTSQTVTRGLRVGESGASSWTGIGDGFDQTASPFPADWDVAVLGVGGETTTGGSFTGAGIGLLSPGALDQVMAAFDTKFAGYALVKAAGPVYQVPMPFFMEPELFLPRVFFFNSGATTTTILLTAIGAPPGVIRKCRL